MLINFFLVLKKARIPVSITELLALLDVLKARLVYADIDQFYYLSRMALVKDERHYDKFDRAFSTYFKGLEDMASMLASLIPDEYLRREFEKSLTKEELEKIKSLGGLEKLIEAFKREVEEAARGEGKDKDKEGKGENGRGKEGKGRKGKKRRGKRTWDRRDYKAYDDNVELGTRGIKISLRRLRKLARTGAEDEFDIDTTIDKTAKAGGLLDIIPFSMPRMVSGNICSSTIFLVRATEVEYSQVSSGVGLIQMTLSK